MTGPTSRPEAPAPSPERQARLFALLYPAAEVETRTRRIYQTMLDRSPRLGNGNFNAIGTDDLIGLFDQYDREFFRGHLGEMLTEDRAQPIGLRLSRRLTRAAGQTTRQIRAVRLGGRTATRVEYEIAISTTLLFGTFQNVERTVMVGGLECRDRLEALQRIFEHELLHLAEFLGWGRSNCSAPNFQTLSRRIFAHEAAVHDLVTPREQAAAAYDLRVGDLASFSHDGRRLVGRINRITRRASLLVEDAGGVLYSDGRRYQTYYVPLPLLRRESSDD
jgi:hypothetical protein